MALDYFGCVSTGEFSENRPADIEKRYDLWLSYGLFDAFPLSSSLVQGALSLSNGLLRMGTGLQV